jgi:choline dehydrogenase-like flavoprotein
VSTHFDIIIIGSGMGGGALAFGLRNSGARVLLIERGDYLPQEPQNWQPAAVFDQGRYKTPETWDSADGTSFNPGMHYYVGGNTKMYGAALPRLRQEDFGALEHEGGTSPAWPVSYAELEPYYTEAEKHLRVHGTPGEDPTEPPRSGPYPFPAVPHEPYIEDLAKRLRQQGLHPFHYPMGIDLRENGACIRCKTCDGFPCQVLAKSDADLCFVRPALQNGNITLWTKTLVKKLMTDETGRRVVGVEIERLGDLEIISADIVVVACGATNTAMLLFQSANDKHPNGLANSSGMVGRNYMVHNNTALMGVAPLRVNPTVFQKTIAINDFYFNGPNFTYPMGNIQALGKLQAGMLTAAQPLVPRPLLQMMADRSNDWWVMSEDLPDPNNRIELGSDGKPRVHWQPNNLVAHQRLIDASRQMLRAAGYQFTFIKRMGIATNSHQCGTARMGKDPATAVLDPYLRTYNVENLYIVDSSFFPSSSAMNPALTIAAMALRTAERITGRLRD